MDYKPNKAPFARQYHYHRALRKAKTGLADAVAAVDEYRRRSPTAIDQDASGRAILALKAGIQALTASTELMLASLAAPTKPDPEEPESGS